MLGLPKMKLLRLKILKPVRLDVNAERKQIPVQASDLVDDNDGKSKRRSPIWQFFWVVKDEGGKVTHTVCKQCGEDSERVAYLGNTTNLRSHIAHVHKDVYCKLCIEEKKKSSTAESGSTETEEKSASAGTIESLLPKVSSEKRYVLHKKFTRWLVKRRRPLYLGETDSELRDLFDYIFQGGYVLPTYKIVVQKVLELSAEGRLAVVDAIAATLEAGILPSIAGDIWSEGGVAIFRILVYWIDADHVLHEKLAAAIPFSDVRHTGPEICAATKASLSAIGIGSYETIGKGSSGIPTVDTVSDFVHCTASDSASNIVSVIGQKLLNKCQERKGLSQNTPPQDNDTRSGWGGAHRQANWYRLNKDAVLLYDIEDPRKASTAAPNPDGSVYRDHKLEPVEWDIVRESVYVLALTKTAVNMLQSTSHPTINLVLPTIGSLAYKLDAATPLKFEQEYVYVQNEHVQHARKLLHQDLCRRYFNELMECKLEDYVVATFLDPRYKNLEFRYLEKWNKGESPLA
ncbi:hypothetical protein CYMTET_51117 [Cymbomonas tetramitiformis]|uniref:BED-type domain-containing protein n=1 Tax=Cymbomonas tetramitiformis TaxID=36881 RepID=A0AAE0ESQ9_9CHLO|nr:hypothetical protein CYMTET_51117 [Cymbomonas tetramitiformis]